MNSILTVSQLNFYIRSILESDDILNSVWLKGEISNFVSHSSGHIYMSIKDSSALIKAVMFKKDALSLKFTPENGMKVIVHGRVSLFERDGQYQIYVDDIHPDGAGALNLAYEQLKDKLSQEGLFDADKKKEIPFFSKRIAVITSKTGAAVRDVINVIKRRCSFCDVIVCPVPVQGDGAYKLISSAVEYVNSKKIADVIIIARGGGSIEDLWNFNEEELARTIFNSNIPVISGVGHETDYTICDFVSDLRAPTPSAAAELATPLTNDIIPQIADYRKRITFASIGNIDKKRALFLRYSAASFKNSIVKELQRKSNDILYFRDKLESVSLRNYSKCKAEFDNNVQKLFLLNPLNLFVKGYSIVSNENGIVKSINDIKISREITIQLCDGKARAVVTGKEKTNG